MMVGVRVATYYKVISRVVLRYRENVHLIIIRYAAIEVYYSVRMVIYMDGDVYNMVALNP